MNIWYAIDEDRGTWNDWSPDRARSSGWGHAFPGARTSRDYGEGSAVRGLNTICQGEKPGLDHDAWEAEVAAEEEKAAGA